MDQKSIHPRLLFIYVFKTKILTNIQSRALLPLRDIKSF
jgi:hypothetical protein